MIYAIYHIYACAIYMIHDMHIWFTSRIGIYDCGAGKFEIFRAETLGRCQRCNPQVKFLLQRNFSFALQAFHWLDEAHSNYLFYLKSADSRCLSHLWNTFTATPRLLFNGITGYYSPAKLTHKTNHHERRKIIQRCYGNCPRLPNWLVWKSGLKMCHTWPQSPCFPKRLVVSGPLGNFLKHQSRFLIPSWHCYFCVIVICVCLLLDWGVLWEKVHV